MRFTVKDPIVIGTAGMYSIELPMLELGEGEPRVLVLAGLHGDEQTSLFVISRLIEFLDSGRCHFERGALSIVPAANPMAQVLNQREEPFGRKDPNRAFPGDIQKDFTQRLTAKLFEQAKQHPDCVIDLHTLEMHSRLMAIFMNHGTHGIRQKSLDFIHAFAPDLIWQLDTTSALGQPWSGSMGPDMARAGIPNFAVEMAAHQHVGDTELGRSVEGLLRVLHYLGMVSTAPEPPATKPLMFGYRSVTSDTAGLFEPSLELLGLVRAGEFPRLAEGDLVGMMTHPKTFERSDVRSKHNGPLVAISGRALVRTGDDLYNIGEIGKPWCMLAESTVSMVAKYAKALRPGRDVQLQRAIEAAEALAHDDGADMSICRAAIWLSALSDDPHTNQHMAGSFLLALPDVDDDTRSWILGCFEFGDRSMPEAQVVRQALCQGGIRGQEDA